jgi:hypothetical protein
MASGSLGQQIDFAIVYDEDRKYTDYLKVTTKPGDSIRKIVGARNRPDMAQEVARLNKVANVNTIIRHQHTRNPRTKRWRTYPHDLMTVRLPGTMRKAQGMSAYADFGGRAPRITAGYAKIESVDRPGRTAISHFTGYDPVRMTLPLTFYAWRPVGQRLDDDKTRGTASIDGDMDLLERMAGRGDFRGAATGTPPLLRISTLDSNGQVVWLIPQNYQWSTENDVAPLWRIADIDWDESPLRNTQGYRMRQDVTVTVEAYTTVTAVARSVVVRKRGRNRPPAPRHRSHR